MNKKKTADQRLLCHVPRHSIRISLRIQLNLRIQLITQLFFYLYLRNQLVRLLVQRMTASTKTNLFFCDCKYCKTWELRLMQGNSIMIQFFHLLFVICELRKQDEMQQKCDSFLCYEGIFRSVFLCLFNIMLMMMFKKRKENSHRSMIFTTKNKILFKHSKKKVFK